MSPASLQRYLRFALIQSFDIEFKIDHVSFKTHYRVQR